MLTVPACVQHKVCTAGEEDLLAIAVLETSVEIFDKASEPIHLPWPHGKTAEMLEQALFEAE